MILLALVAGIYGAVNTVTNGNIYIIDRNEQKITHNFQFGVLEGDNGGPVDTVQPVKPKEDLMANKLPLDGKDTSTNLEQTFYIKRRYFPSLFLHLFHPEVTMRVPIR